MKHNNETRDPYLKNRRFVREGISFKKSYLLLLIIFLQLVLLIVSYIYYVSAFTWIYVVSYIISFVTSLRVMLFTKNPAAKSSWILFLMLFPTFGFIIYFLAGGSHFHPRHKRQLVNIDKYANAKLIKNNLINLNETETENVTYLHNVTNATVYPDSGTKYYALADDIFPAIFKAIREARHSIYVEFFIMSRGELFNELIELLLEKAEAGIDVFIIYDGFGSKDLMNRALKKTLKASKIKIKAFQPITPIFSFFLNYRDHRKMVIVDNNIAFIGGFNFADEYANIHKRFGHWKDNGIELRGPSVHYFSLEFLKMWMFVSKEALDLTPFTFEKQLDVRRTKGLVVPYVSAPYQDGSVARSFYVNLINNARKSIKIMTPYLIIDEDLIDLLKTKVLSGVEVSIILPGIPDKKSVYALSKATGHALSEAGCHVYVYDKGFIHAKTILIDEASAVVGSINFDFRSFYQQYENAVYLTNAKVISDINDDFNATIKTCSYVKASRLRKLRLTYRLYIGLLKWVSPLM